MSPEEQSPEAITRAAQCVSVTILLVCGQVGISGCVCVGGVCKAWHTFKNGCAPWGRDV